MCKCSRCKFSVSGSDLSQNNGPSLAYGASILVDDHWNRNETKTKESQQGIAPSETQCFIHFWSSKRKQTSKQRSECRESRQR